MTGRSRPYDDLLLDWNREHNPNFVEPVKKESKQERKERKEKEKAEKKRQAAEAAIAAGQDPNAKKTGGAGGSGSKKSKKAGGAAATMTMTAATAAIISKPDDVNDNEDLDSEEEVDALVHAVRVARSKGVMGVPLAVPCDASSWFVARRERLRTCRVLLSQALGPTRQNPGGLAVATGPPRMA